MRRASSPSRRMAPDTPSSPAKQISDTRTPRPSTTHGSSDQASKIAALVDDAVQHGRLRPPRMEFVADQAGTD